MSGKAPKPKKKVIVVADAIAHNRMFKDLCRPHVKHITKDEETRNRMRFAYAQQIAPAVMSALGLKEDE